MGARSPAASPRPAARPQQAHPPAPVQHAPAPVQHAPAQGGMMSGIGGAVVTGMAMGTGSEIAHQAIRGIMGSGSSSNNGQAPAQQENTQQAPAQYA